MKEIISIKTDYNVLSSMIKLPDLFSYSVTNNINTLGIVDDNLCYVAEFLKLCQKYNIKPVIGLEVNYQNHKIYLYNVIISHISSSAILPHFQASFSLTYIIKKRTNNGG